MATLAKPALSLTASARAAATEQAKADAVTPMLRGTSSAARSGAGRRRAVVAALDTYSDKQLAALSDATDHAVAVYVARLLAATGVSLRETADVVADTLCGLIDNETPAPSMPTGDNVRNAAGRILAKRTSDAKRAQREADKAKSTPPK